MFFTILLKEESEDETACWHLKGGFGNAQHVGHHKLSQQEKVPRTANLTESELEQAARDVIKGSSGMAVSNLLDDTGMTFSRHQAFYILSKKKRIEYKNTRSSNEPESYLETTSAERLLRNLTIDSDTSYIALYCEFQDTALFAEKGKGRPAKGQTRKAPKGQKVSKIIAEIRRENGIDELMTLPPLDEEHQNKIEDCYGHMRDQMKVGSKILLAIAWVKGSERRLFELFPEVGIADVTAGTNNEKRPLFIFVGRDSNGKTFYGLRAYLPSECRWVFHWLWSEAIPKLLGPENVKRIQLILTDGDINLYEPLDACLPKYYPSAMTGLCIFHLVMQPLEKLPFMFKDDESTKDLVYKFKCWVFSWMREGGVETMAQFEDSLARLRRWLGTEMKPLGTINKERLEHLLKAEGTIDKLLDKKAEQAESPPPLADKLNDKGSESPSAPGTIDELLDNKAEAESPPPLADKSNGKDSESSSAHSYDSHVSEKPLGDNQPTYHENEKENEGTRPMKRKKRPVKRKNAPSEAEAEFGKMYNAVRLQEFLMSKLLPLKHRWLYFLRSDCRTRGETTTSRAESSNSAMKYLSSDKVRPSMSLDTSAETMSRQSNVGHHKNQKKVMRDAESDPLWTDSETAKHVMGRAEEEAQTQMRLSHLYSIARVDQDTFYCLKCTTSCDSGQKAPWMPESDKETQQDKQRHHQLSREVPRYRNVRTLKIIRLANGIICIVCDCKYFKKFGIVCRHVCKLLGTVRLEYFLPRDLRSYAALCLRQSCDEITEQLHCMVETNLPGPVLTPADMQHLDDMFGTTFPSFMGDGPADLAFYERILHAPKPVLVDSKDNEQIPDGGDDDEMFPSIEEDSGGFELLTQEENFTFEVQEGAAWQRWTEGRGFAELRPLLVEYGKILDAFPNELPNVMHYLHKGLGELNQRVAQQNAEHQQTAAGGVASCNLATDKRKVSKRIKGSHER